MRVNSPYRYMIPRYTDVEQFFSINAEDGMITTTRPLDREAQAWHNISVSATEIGTYAHSYTHTHRYTSRNILRELGLSLTCVGMWVSLQFSLSLKYRRQTHTHTHF